MRALQNRYHAELLHQAESPAKKERVWNERTARDSLLEEGGGGNACVCVCVVRRRTRRAYSTFVCVRRWQDKYRALSLYGTWALIAVNSCIFVASSALSYSRELGRIEVLRSAADRRENAPHLSPDFSFLFRIIGACFWISRDSLCGSIASSAVR